MQNVAIIGIGKTPVGEHWETSLRMLAAEAIQECLNDAGLSTVDALYIGNAYGSTHSSQSHLGALITDYVGMTGLESYTIEAAEASGGVALRTGYLAVASGTVRTAMVLGVEKSTDAIGSSSVGAATTGLDADFEAAQGSTLTAMAALLMRRYMYEYDVDLSVFEGFSINAHANGSLCKHAMFNNRIKPGAFAKMPMVSDPVGLFDSAPNADGAAAVILTTAEQAGDMVPQPIQIVGSSVATDTLTLQDRADFLWLNAVRQSVEQVYAQANIKSESVDLFELHDAFTILSTLTLEAAGFAGRGQGWKWAVEGESAIGLQGKLPISTFGGLKSRGNPAGATGVYQAIEATLQLRGLAGNNQVSDAKVALIQNLGGLGSTVVTHALRAV